MSPRWLPLMLAALLAGGACGVWDSTGDDDDTGPSDDDTGPGDDDTGADDDDQVGDDDQVDDDDQADDDDTAGDDDDDTHTDADGDGYTPADGDCDDSDPGVNPGMVEYCDDKDNDCDGQLDEEPQDCTVANGTAGCVAAECVVAACDTGWFDSDDAYATGCEVAEDAWEALGGNSCAQAVDQWGALTDDPVTLESIRGNLAYDHFDPTPDEDWFAFVAVDVPEAEGGCDPFDVDVNFSSNPGNVFRFEVYDTSCNLWSGPGEACGSDLTIFSWDAGDECPCSYTNTEGHDTCTDNGFGFVVRVIRGAGGPDGAEYEISVGNG